MLSFLQGLIKMLPLGDLAGGIINAIAGAAGKGTDESMRKLAVSIDASVARRLAEERALFTEEIRALKTVVRALVILVVVLVLAVIAIAAKLFFLK